MVRSILASLVLAFSIAACGNKPIAPTSSTQEKTESNTTKSVEYSGKDTVFHANYTIKLPEGYKIDPQPGADNNVYYFTPIDTTIKRGEAGIYFGARPDDSAPSTEFTKNEMPGIFLGQSVTWVEYTTDAYTQRETFLQTGPEMRIHCWCYSDNPKDLEMLFEMVKSIHQ
jgi:predicted small lipoprotein YifL